MSSGWGGTSFEKLSIYYLESICVLLQTSLPFKLSVGERAIEIKSGESTSIIKYAFYCVQGHRLKTIDTTSYCFLNPSAISSFLLSLNAEEAAGTESQNDQIFSFAL